MMSVNRRTVLALVIFLLVSATIMTFAVQAYSSSVENGSVEITIQGENGDRASTYQMILKVYQDSRKNSYIVLDPLASNPYVLTSLPLGHKYIVEAYVNGMYADVRSIILNDSKEEKLTITIPPTGGIRFDVFYNDGITPVEGAAVTIRSHDGRVWHETSTDKLGETPRFWMGATIRPDNYYMVTISMGKNLVYEQSFIKLERGSRIETKIVTPWTSRVDELIVSLHKTPSYKVSSSDGEFQVELYDSSMKKVAESHVNRKGDAYFTGIPVGDYTLRVFKQRENISDNPEKWASKRITIASRHITVDIIEGETSSPVNDAISTSIGTTNKAVILTFDDGYSSQFKNAKSILDKYGFKGTFFIVCNYAGSRNNDSLMTWEEIETLHKEGHDIQSHTMNHKDLTTLSKPDLEFEIGQSKQCMLDHKINSTIFAMPYHKGWNNATVIKTISKYYDFARGGTGAVMDLKCMLWTPMYTNQDDCRTYFHNGTPTWANRFSIRGWSHDPLYNNLQDDALVFGKFVEEVNRSVVNEDGTVEQIPVLVYHSIDDEKTESSAPIGLFDAEMKYLHDHGFKVLTMSNLAYDENTGNLFIDPNPRPKIISYEPALSPLVATNSTFTIGGPLAQNITSSLPTEPACNCVVFRLDDVQDSFVRPAQLAVLDLFLSKRQSLTAGVVLGEIGNDTEIISKVKEGSQKGLFELALHGWDHVDYTELSSEAQKNSLIEANSKMQKLFGNGSDIFIPPLNRFDVNTLLVLEQIGVKIISASFDFDDGPYFLADGRNRSSTSETVYHLPSVIAFKDRPGGSREWVKTPISSIEGNVTASVQKYGYAIITLHPQDFVFTENGKFIKTLDIEEVRDLAYLIDSVLAKGMRITTMSEIADIEPRIYQSAEAEEPSVSENIILNISTRGDAPTGVAVNPSTNMVYVSNSNSNFVSAILGLTNSVISSIQVGSTPFGVAVNPSTNMVYVINWYSDSISVIDGATNSVVSSVAVGGNPQGIAVNPSTNMVYVSKSDTDSLAVIDGATNAVSTIKVGSAPFGVAVNPSTNMVYVINSSGSVSVIDGATNSVVSSIAVGGNPQGIAVNSNTNMVYVINSSGSVSVIDGATNNVVSSIAVGGNPQGIAVNPSTNMVYVSKSDSDAVAVIDTDPEPAGLIDTESPRIGTDKINPSILIEPEVVEAGKMIVVTGKGFSGNAELAIILGEHESASIRAEADGSMRAVLMIPATVDDGSYTLKVTDNKNGVATQNVMVKNSGTLQSVDKEPQQVFDSILAQLEKIQKALNLLLQKVDSSGNK